LSFHRLILLFATCAAPSLAQGFGVGAAVAIGKRGESVTLARTLPPIVDLTGMKVNFEANGIQGVPRDVVDILTIRGRAVLAKELGYKIQIVNADAQRLVRCMIPVFELTDTRQEQQTGTATEQFLVVKGNMAAIVDVLDARTGRTLDSENLRTTYEKWFRTNLTDPGQSQGVNISIRKKNKKLSNERIPTLQEKYAAVAEGIVTKLANMLVPPAEKFAVPLPRRKLKILSAMATRGQWTQLREAAEKFTPLPNPEDDTYRTYLLGLAAEAQAYKDSRNFTEAPKLLKEAIDYYTKAKDAKPEEKAFGQAAARAQEALDRYNRIQTSLRSTPIITSQPPNAAFQEKVLGGNQICLYTEPSVLCALYPGSRKLTQHGKEATHYAQTD
jgi:hypothetical protein